MQYQSQRGFTIVELLIVIVVIGILAAIVIVAYTGIQRQATTASVRSELSSIHKKLELFKVNNPSGTYPTTAQIESESLITINKSNYLTPDNRSQFYYCRSSNQQSYALGVITKDSLGFIMANGSVTEQSPSSLYGAHTCNSIGWDSANGNPGSASSGWNSVVWGTWIKG